jgi:hypothetical protein
MTRSQFINTWCEMVRVGRRKNYPDMRPSEEAFSAIDDQKKAAAMWRKHRVAFAACTVEQFKAKVGA